MTKQTWIFVWLFSMAVFFGFGAIFFHQQKSALERLEASVAEARAGAEKNASEAAALKAELESAKTRASALSQEKDQATQAQKELEQQMRSALQSKEITISELQGKLTVSILDRILFESGETTIKPEGEQVLLRIASVLTNVPNRQIHVIGHTDNVPMGAWVRDRFPSNWELSTSRATAAVRFLQEKAGVDPRRLGAVGYGEYRPIAENTTADGRAQNRRITVVVLPEEIGAFEPPPSTNAPAPLKPAELDSKKTEPQPALDPTAPVETSAKPVAAEPAPASTPQP